MADENARGEDDIKFEENGLIGLFSRGLKHAPFQGSFNEIVRFRYKILAFTVGLLFFGKFKG